MAAAATELIPKLLALRMGVEAPPNLVAPVSSSRPCPITAYAGVTGRSVRFGMSFDLPGIRAMILAAR
jgi:hypothetical protein